MTTAHGTSLVPLLPAGWFDKPRYELRDCGHETPCWAWLLTRNDHGYGLVTIRAGARRLCVVAHRLFYERAHGPILDPALQVDHLCRNRACVNPDHMEVVSARENVRRSRGGFRLTDEQVREIRQRPSTAAVLAARFGVSESQIRHVWNGRAYTAVAS